MSVESFISALASAMWGRPLMVVLLAAGVYLTLRLKFVQVRHFKHGWELITGKFDDPSEQGDVTHFQALSAALSATIGTGNIVGVATAIASGGPGAVFWMWVTGFLGMVNKFASCALALKFRVIHEDGTASGGPMYYLDRGLGMRWLAIMFAFCTMVACFGIGCMVQSNSAADALYDTFRVPRPLTGVVMAGLVALVVFGGMRRIGQVTCRLTPAMCVIYVLGAIIVLVRNAHALPGVFASIFVHAFTPTAAMGAFVGVTVRETIRYGVARGLFSNEGGLGSAPIAHAAAKTSEPIREGLVAMLGPFVDTLIVCTMTALTILSTGAWTMPGEGGAALTGAALTNRAFDLALPGLGRLVVTVGLVLFSFSTVLTWPYYGDRCAEYLFGRKAIPIYRAIHVVLLALGAAVELHLVWNVSDIMNGLMAFPNLIGIVGLSGLLARELDAYFRANKHKQPNVTRQRRSA